jgi:IS30 family transposase
LQDEQNARQEGDLIYGAKNSYIATVVERQTRFTVLVRVESKNTEHVVSALSEQMKNLPEVLKQSLTWDRGQEMAQHRAFTLATDMDVCFCDPRSPWQRGTNENTNGLLRQYFPRGDCLSDYTQAELNVFASKLNTRPRKTLGFRTPAETLAELLRRPVESISTTYWGRVRDTRRKSPPKKTQRATFDITLEKFNLRSESHLSLAYAHRVDDCITQSRLRVHAF